MEKPILVIQQNYMLKRAIKNYAKNVAGGAKIVGGAIKNARTNPPKIIKRILEPAVQTKVKTINKGNAQKVAAKALNAKYSR